MVVEKEMGIEVLYFSFATNQPSAFVAEISNFNVLDQNVFVFNKPSHLGLLQYNSFFPSFNPNNWLAWRSCAMIPKVHSIL